MKLKSPSRTSLTVRFTFRGKTYTRNVAATNRQDALKSLSRYLLTPADTLTILSAYDSQGTLCL